MTYNVFGETLNLAQQQQQQLLEVCNYLPYYAFVKGIPFLACQSVHDHMLIDC